MISLENHPSQLMERAKAKNQHLIQREKINQIQRASQMANLHQKAKAKAIIL